MVKVDKRSEQEFFYDTSRLRELFRVTSKRNLSDLQLRKVQSPHARLSVVFFYAQVTLYFCVNYHFLITFGEKGSARETTLIFIH